jgi:hypothetical protein
MPWPYSPLFPISHLYIPRQPRRYRVRFRYRVRMRRKRERKRKRPVVFIYIESILGFNLDAKDLGFGFDWVCLDAFGGREWGEGTCADACPGMRGRKE